MYNDGTVNGVKYFNAPKGRAIFAQKHEIRSHAKLKGKNKNKNKHKNPKKALPKIIVGSVVLVKSLGCSGFVRFIGEIDDNISKHLIKPKPKFKLKLKSKQNQQTPAMTSNMNDNDNINTSNNDICYGIELKLPKGNHNGTLSKRFYFGVSNPNASGEGIAITTDHDHDEKETDNYNSNRNINANETQTAQFYGVFTVAENISKLHGTANNSVNIYNYEREKQEKIILNKSHNNSTSILDSRKRFPYVSEESLVIWKRETVVQLLLPYLNGIHDIGRLLCSFVPHINKIVYASDDDNHMYDVKQKIAFWPMSNGSINNTHKIAKEFSGSVNIENTNSNTNDSGYTRADFRGRLQLTRYLSYLTLSGVTAFIMLNVFPLGRSYSDALKGCNGVVFVYDVGNLDFDSDGSYLRQIESKIELLQSMNASYDISEGIENNSNRICYIVFTNVKEYRQRTRTRKDQRSLERFFPNQKILIRGGRKDKAKIKGQGKGKEKVEKVTASKNSKNKPKTINKDEIKEKEKENESKEFDYDRLVDEKIKQMKGDVIKHLTEECYWQGLIEVFVIEDEDDITEIDDMMMKISLHQIKRVRRLMLKTKSIKYDNVDEKGNVN